MHCRRGQDFLKACKEEGNNVFLLTMKKLEHEEIIISNCRLIYEIVKLSEVEIAAIDPIIKSKLCHAPMLAWH